jgi:hypothetical protein
MDCDELSLLVAVRVSDGELVEVLLVDSDGAGVSDSEIEALIVAEEVALPVGVIVSAGVSEIVPELEILDDKVLEMVGVADSVRSEADGDGVPVGDTLSLIV